MPLSAALKGLGEDINQAFKNKTETYESFDKAPSKDVKDKIDEIFANELALAIHKYCLQADVIGTIGGVCTGVAGPLAPTGMTYAGGPVSGMIIPGTGKLI